MNSKQVIAIGARIENGHTAFSSGFDVGLVGELWGIKNSKPYHSVVPGNLCSPSAISISADTKEPGRIQGGRAGPVPLVFFCRRAPEIGDAVICADAIPVINLVLWKFAVDNEPSKPVRPVLASIDVNNHVALAVNTSSLVAGVNDLASLNPPCEGASLWAVVEGLNSPCASNQVHCAASFSERSVAGAGQGTPGISGNKGDGVAELTRHGRTAANVIGVSSRASRSSASCTREFQFAAHAMGPLVAIQESARTAISTMAHLLGGLGRAFPVRWDVAMALTSLHFTIEGVPP